MPPLDQARALLSSPVNACCGAVVINHGPVQFRPSGQFCSHPEIENGLSAGVQAEAVSSSDAWGRHASGRLSQAVTTTSVPGIQAGATSDVMGTSSA